MSVKYLPWRRFRDATWVTFLLFAFWNLFFLHITLRSFFTLFFILLFVISAFASAIWRATRSISLRFCFLFTLSMFWTRSASWRWAWTATRTTTRVFSSKNIWLNLKDIYILPMLSFFRAVSTRRWWAGRGIGTILLEVASFTTLVATVTVISLITFICPI